MPMFISVKGEKAALLRKEVLVKNGSEK